VAAVVAAEVVQGHGSSGGQGVTGFIADRTDAGRHPGEYTVHRYVLASGECCSPSPSRRRLQTARQVTWTTAGYMLAAFLHMPNRPCPNCGKAAGRFLVETSKDARVDYYRCDSCGAVWTLDRIDPTKPQKFVTPQKPRGE
jgi:predicted RNA-binding Zn-ribbon protein involved in translation (DUF1610 family)